MTAPGMETGEVAVVDVYIYIYIYIYIYDVSDSAESTSPRVEEKWGTEIGAETRCRIELKLGNRLFI